MKNMIQPGKTIDFVNSTESPIAGGSLLFFGADQDMIGVASATVQPGGSGSARMEGVFRLPKDNSSVVQGDALYATPSTGILSATAAAGAVYVGRAWEAAAADAAAVAVRINFLPPQAEAASEA